MGGEDFLGLIALRVVSILRDPVRLGAFIHFAFDDDEVLVIASLIRGVSGLPQLLDQMTDLATAGVDLSNVGELIRVAEGLSNSIGSLVAFGETAAALGQWPGMVEDWLHLLELIVSDAIVSILVDRIEPLVFALYAAGLCEREIIGGVSEDAGAFIWVMRWERFERLSDFPALLSSVYGFGRSSDFQPTRLLTSLSWFFQLLGATPLVESPANVSGVQTSQLVWLPGGETATNISPVRIVVVPVDSQARGRGVSVHLELLDDLQDSGRLRISGAGSIRDQLLYITNSELVLIGQPVSIGVAYELIPAVGPSVPLFAVGTLLNGSVRGARLRTHVSGGEGVEGEVAVAIEIDDFEIALRLSSLGSCAVLGEASSFSASGRLSVLYSSSSGWSLSGTSLGFRIGLGRVCLGPVYLSLAIRFGVQSDGRLNAQSLITVEFRLGPVQLRLDDLGIGVDIAPPREGSTFRCLPGIDGPTGLGASIDSGVVVGAGFILYSQAQSRYTGSLRLSVGSVAVGAVGLLEMPQNASGYSFLIVISAEFTPVQIGFGFTLNGVGGLCGIQRSVNIESLQRGVRDGSLAPVLFMRDPVSQASRIVTAISAIFPATQDSYVFGPLFKLGWGTPTLVTITLGLVIKLPDPITIALIGQVEVRLPKPEAAIVEVNIDILGLLLPDEKLLSIEARLRDSKVAGWTLTGGMAFRLTWGAEPNFLFSVGGFNPHFRPPPSFPQIERLALALGTGSNPRVSLAAYFAITSNSLQFGARAELYAEALGFSIQGYLEFHALFIFSPFSFRFDFAAGVALKRGSSVIAGITVAGTLSGPRPWRVQGSASISLIFFDVSVSFDETFGQPAEPEQIEAVDAWSRLREALQDLRHWSAPLPVGTHRGVSTAADAETPARLCLDPLSGITLSQKILPLEQRISKLGEAPIVGGASVFRIARVRIGTEGAGGALIDTAPHRDSFAAAQYQPLTDSERLSRPSYEPMIAGVESRADIARSGVGAVVDRQWQTVFMRSDDHMEGPASPAAAALMLEMSSATGGGLSAVGMDRFAAAPGTLPVVSMAPEMWVASSTEDLKPARDQAPSSSYSTAEGSLRVIEGADDSITFQVVPAWEAA